MKDNDSMFWYIGLTEATNYINSLINITRLYTSFEATSRQKIPIIYLIT